MVFLGGSVRVPRASGSASSASEARPTSHLCRALCCHLCPGAGGHHEGQRSVLDDEEGVRREGDGGAFQVFLRVSHVGCAATTARPYRPRGATGRWGARLSTTLVVPWPWGRCGRCTPPRERAGDTGCPPAPPRTCCHKTMISYTFLPLPAAGPRHSKNRRRPRSLSLCAACEVRLRGTCASPSFPPYDIMDIAYDSWPCERP
jgi:hypothetical protein